MTQRKPDGYDSDSQCYNNSGSAVGGSPTFPSNVGAIFPDFAGLTLAQAIALVGKMHDEWDRKTETNSVPRQSSATIDQNRPASSDSDAWTDDEDQNDGTGQIPEVISTDSGVSPLVAYTKASGKARPDDSRYPNRDLLAKLAKERTARNAAKAQAEANAKAEKPITAQHGPRDSFYNVTAARNSLQSITSRHGISANNVHVGEGGSQFLGELPSWLVPRR